MGQKVHPLGFRLGITYSHKGQWFEEMKTYPDSVYQDFVLRNCLLNSFKSADITSINIERSFNQVVVKVTAARSRLLISNIKEITNYLNALLKFMALQGKTLTAATALANINLINNSPAIVSKWNNKIAHQKRLVRARANADLIYSNKSSQTSKETAPAVEGGNEKSDFSEYEPHLSLLIGSSSQENISNSAFLTAKNIQEQLEKRIPFRRAVKAAVGKAGALKGIKIQISGRLNGAEIARSEWIRQGRVPLHTLRAQVDYCSHQARTQYGILGIKVWIFRGYQE